MHPYYFPKTKGDLAPDVNSAEAEKARPHLSHALAVHGSQLSLHTCLPILLEHKFPGERDYGLVKWNGKESNIC